MSNFDICFLSIMFPENDEKYRKNVKVMRAQNITAIRKKIGGGVKRANSNNDIYFINTPLVALFPNGFKLLVILKSGFICADDVGYGMNHSFINVLFLYSTSLFYGARSLLKDGLKKTMAKRKSLLHIC